MTVSGSQPKKKEEPERSLLDDLRRPEAYPAPRPSAGRRRSRRTSPGCSSPTVRSGSSSGPSTTGSWTTRPLERRRRCCEDEVRLNRRLAPDVYLGVVPVRLGPQGHWFGADGEIVDYAVRMRRLPDERSMEALLRRGRADRASTSSAWPRGSPVSSRPRASAPEAGAIEAHPGHRRRRTSSQVEPFVGRFVSREVLDAVRDWQLGTLARAGSALRGAGPAGPHPGRPRRPPARARLLRGRRADRHRLRRVQRAPPRAGTRPAMWRSWRWSWRRGRAPISPERFLAEFARRVRRPRPLRRHRLLRELSRVGAGQGGGVPGGGPVDAPGEGGAEGRARREHSSRLARAYAVERADPTGP